MAVDNASSGRELDRSRLRSLSAARRGRRELLARNQRLHLLGHVGDATDGPEDLAAVVDDGASLALQPVDAPVGPDDAVVNDVCALRGDGGLDGGDHVGRVFGMQQRHVGLVGAVELTGPEPEELLDLRIPFGLATAHVPAPRTEPTRLECQREAPGEVFRRRSSTLFGHVFGDMTSASRLQGSSTGWFTEWTRIAFRRGAQW